MPKSKAPNLNLKTVHRQLLTPLVLRKARHLQGFKKVWFREWCKSTRVEFLPDNTPYKLSSDTWIRTQGEDVRGF